MKHDTTMARQGSPISAAGVFSRYARDTFAECYPETPHKLRHTLPDHPMLKLDALAELGESLPERSVEYNRGDLPIAVSGKPEGNGLTIGETIRGIAETGSWAVLKNIEQNPAYGALLAALVGELQTEIETRTGRIMKMQGFIFVSSPGAVTPYHFDPEHNILLQLAGTKVFTQFPAGDTRYVPDELHEAYHTGGPRELRWNEAMGQGGTEWALAPGDAVYVPVMAPHHVKVGPDPAISLSITWRSEWSFAEADARAFNALLRRVGLTPMPPERWPGTNRAKALAWRVWRKFLPRRR